MSTQAVRAAFKKLASMNNNLLTADPADMGKYKMGWAPPAWMGNERKEHTKGLWNDGVRTCVFPLIGTVDADKSSLGDYGNCWYDHSKGVPPSRAALAKSKFKIGLTFPKVSAGDQDSDLVDAVSNQMLCLEAIEDAANDALNAASEDGDRFTTTDWVTFEDMNGTPVGWIHATIGAVYESKVKKIRGRDIKKGSMSQAPSEAIEKEDIVNDGQDFLKGIRNHGLKHNESLPCFLPNGDRMGRTPQDLRRELYHGRWVRMDVELVMWNMKAEGKRIFQLSVVRLEVLSAPPIASDPTSPPFSLASYSVGKGTVVADSKTGSDERSDAKTSDEPGAVAAVEAEGVDKSGGTEVVVVAPGDSQGSTSNMDVENDSEATLSDADKKGNERKRPAASQGGRTKKLAK